MALLTPAPEGFQQKIRSELTEGLQLSYYDIIPVVLHMRTTLNSTGARPAATFTGGSSLGTDIYRVPNTYNFLVSEIHGHLAMNAIGAEDTVGATGLNALVGVRNRTIVKALNARALLVNADRNDLQVIDPNIQNSNNNATQSPLTLASIMPVAGGEPVRLIQGNRIFPLIVPGNERLKLTVILADANAALGATEYGLTLFGAFVRATAG